MASRRLQIKSTINLTSSSGKTNKTSFENTVIDQKTIERESDKGQINLTYENYSAIKSENETVNINGENVKSSTTKTKRRRIKPPVALHQRKCKLNVEGRRHNSELGINPENSCGMISKPEVGVEELKEPSSSAYVLNHCKESDQITNCEEPIDDSLFKTPQLSLSPRYNPRTPDTNLFETEISPLMVVANEFVPKDDKNGSLPIKVRQRIKVGPILGNPRGSIQARDEDGEIPRRLRHFSSSSSLTTQNPSINCKIINSPGYQYPYRLRTELCSNGSDLSIVRDRTENRSEEPRLNEAKCGFKEWSQNSVPEKSKLKIYDMIFYNPSSSPMTKALTTKAGVLESRSAQNITSDVKKRCLSLPDPAENVVRTYQPTQDSCAAMKSKSEEDAMPVPQLKIGPNGDIIIDKSSLIVELTCENTARETLANSSIVYDDEFSGTQGFYKRQTNKQNWGRSETIRFYQCLQTTGTDFTMMAQLFPKRDRRELKLKFKKEEKNNPALVDKALLFPKSFSIEELQKVFKRDEETQRLEAEKLQQELNELKRTNSSTKKRKYYVSRTFQCLQKGEFIYENENLLFKNMTKHRRTRNKIYESRIENEIFKAQKLSEDVPADRKITKNEINSYYEIGDDDLNNSDGNIYTPNFNTLTPQLKHDRSSSILANENCFVTLVNDCGKSYFSNDNKANTKSDAESIIESEATEYANII